MVKFNPLLKEAIVSKVEAKYRPLLKRVTALLASGGLSGPETNRLRKRQRRYAKILLEESLRQQKALEKLEGQSPLGAKASKWSSPSTPSAIEELRLSEEKRITKKDCKIPKSSAHGFLRGPVPSSGKPAIVNDRSKIRIPHTNERPTSAPTKFKRRNRQRFVSYYSISRSKKGKQ